MPNEDLLSEKLLQPMVQLSYAAAMDLVQARLRLINADLTEQCHRQVIRNMSCRIKTPDSVTKKLKKKGREVSFEEAVQTLNDIAGIRVVSTSTGLRMPSRSRRIFILSRKRIM